MTTRHPNRDGIKEDGECWYFVFDGDQDAAPRTALAILAGLEPRRSDLSGSDRHLKDQVRWQKDFSMYCIQLPGLTTVTIGALACVFFMQLKLPMVKWSLQQLFDLLGSRHLRASAPCGLEPPDQKGAYDSGKTL